MKIKKIFKHKSKKSKFLNLKTFLICLTVMLAFFFISFQIFFRGNQNNSYAYSPNKPLIMYNFNPKTIRGKYLEVNLTTQRLYQYENQVVVKERIISSGTPKLFTPQGKFRIGRKNPLGTAYTGDKIPWVMQIHKDILFHQLPVRKDGSLVDQDKLGQQASHGCIRVNIVEAKELYDWTPKGTPVWIHK